MAVLKTDCTFPKASRITAYSRQLVGFYGIPSVSQFFPLAADVEVDEGVGVGALNGVQDVLARIELVRVRQKRAENAAFLLGPVNLMSVGYFSCPLLGPLRRRHAR